MRRTLAFLTFALCMPAIAGKASAADKAAVSAAEYPSLVMARIKQNWVKPAEVPGKFFCVVGIEQDRDGTVLAVKMTKSCGTEALDASLVRAVWDSSPLPAMGVTYYVRHIDYGFHFAPRPE